MKTNDQLLQEPEDLQNRLKEMEEALHDLRNTEETVRKSDREKTAILNSLSEEIAYLDMDMKVLWTNKTAIESAGLAPEQIVGRYCYEVWCKKGKPLLDCPAVRTIKTGQRGEGEISIPDGRTLLHRSYPARDEKGNRTGAVVITANITERKQAEEVLRESENAYRTLAENLPGMVYRVFIRENNRMEFFNKMLQPMTGYAVEELTAGEVCSIEPLILSEDREAVITIVKRAILDHQPFEVEYRLRTKGGETRYFHERGRPIYGEDDEPLYIDGLIFDITRRKKNEEELQKQAQILDQIHDSVISTDLEGRVVTWNKGAERIFGYSAEEGLGKHISFVYPQDQHEFLQYQLIDPLKKKGRHEIEVKMRRKSGEDFYAHLSLSVLRNKEGLEIGMIGSAVDLTERRQFEEELRRSRDELELRVQERTAELFSVNQDLEKAGELLETLFSTIDIMIAYLDRDFNFLRVNRALAEDDGRPPEFFVGKNLFDLFPDVNRQDFETPVKTGEPIYGYGKPFVHPKHPERGATYWDWSVQPVKDPEGNVAGVVASFANVTERKRAEETLRESERRLRFLSSQLLTVQEQERKRIAGELHEGLGALLSGIKYKVEAALQQRAKNKPEAAEKQLESVIPMIQESVEEVRRIQTGLRPVTLDSLGVLATLRSLCRKFETTYPSISVQQQIDIGEDDIPSSLKIVIYRISQEALNNIAKHSKADLVRLFMRKTEGGVELVIQDNGRGFDVKEALSAESSGQGLGVPSMRERAELSGGSFTIESIVGKGTTIRSSWPCILEK
jgi:PAS domain S-box-containing protein